MSERLEPTSAFAGRDGNKERGVTIALAAFAVAAPLLLATVAVFRLGNAVDPAIALLALALVLLGPGLAAIVVTVKGMSAVGTALAAMRESEPQQAIVRIFFTGVVLAYLTGLAGLGVDTATLLPLLAVDIPGILVAWLLFVHLIADPPAAPARRLAAMLSDVVFVSVFLHVGAGYAAPWFAIYLWIIFGFGFRYGLRELAISAVLSVIAFGGVVATTPYWQARPAESAGVYVALALLPSYAATLVRRLHAARAAAEEAAAAKSRFLAVMSHELRTPLNSFIGMGALFARTNLDAEQRDMLATMRLSAQTLLGLINDLLDLSKLEAGKLRPAVESFALPELLGGVIALVKPQAEAKHLALTLSIDPRLPVSYRGAPLQLRQVLLNLLANAIKFTARGRIAVTASFVERETERVRLRLAVKDEGVGIPPEAIDRIFEVFTQADETVARRFGGTGLGLAISKQLVELMGGTIAATSEPGRGSTFTVTLALEPDASAPATAPELGGRRLALVSRDGDLAALIQERVRVWHGELRWHRDEPAALADFSSVDSRPALAMLDGRVNPMAALAFAHRLTTEHTEPPVIVVIAPEGGSDAIAGIGAAELAAVIEAPVRPEALASALMSALASNPRQRQVESEPAAEPAVPVAPPPAAVASPLPSPTPLPPPRPAQPLKVLVADDNAANCKILKKVLEMAGHQAVVVADGEQALAALERDRFDLALLDINMPDVTGYEVAKLYRMSHVGEWRLPIVALTADVTSETERLCREAGMDAVLTKPMEPAQLLAALTDIHAKAAAGDRRPIFAPQVVTPISVHPRFVPDAGAVVDEQTFVALKSLGGSEFVVEVVDTFRKDARRLIEDLREAVERGDLRDFRDVTHSLRSGAANVGGVRLCEALTAMREVTANDLTRTGPAYFDKIVNEFSRLDASLEQMTRAERRG
ncbi:MAG: response regulator [Alphaproteobacteria bacterium]|nr:response regulator [Alphaproteobacteria bacterium]